MQGFMIENNEGVLLSHGEGLSPIKQLCELLSSYRVSGARYTRVSTSRQGCCPHGEAYLLGMGRQRPTDTISIEAPEAPPLLGQIT